MPCYWWVGRETARVIARHLIFKTMDYEPLKRETEEFYDLMRTFEQRAVKTTYIYNFEREDKELWKVGAYYKNGKTNDMWLTFMWGYEHGKRTQWEKDEDNQQ